MTVALPPGVPRAHLTVNVEDYLGTAADVPAAIQAAITAATVAGTVDGAITFKPYKTYDYGTGSVVPSFYKNVACAVYGNRATLKLSATCPRAFDFNKTVDLDYFKNITLDGLIIDVNHVGGKHHSLIGTYQAGTNQTKLSVTGLRVRRCKVINADSCSSLNNYSTATNHRLCVHIAPTNHTTGELTDIRFEDCRFEGGNEGIFVGVGGAPDTSTTIDDVHILRCWHSTMAAPTAFFASANFQLGSYAIGGHFTITGCKGYYSGDVGIEIDGHSTCEITDTEIEDAWDYDFYFTNFTTPADVTSGGTQTTTYTRCTARKVLVGNGNGWQFSNANAVTATLGAITLDDCKMVALDAGFALQGEAIRSTTADIPRLVLNNFRYDAPNKDYSAVGSGTPQAITLTTAATTTVNAVVIRGLTINVTAAHSGGGSYTWSPIQLTGNTYVLDWDDIRPTFNNTGTLLNHTHLGLNFGPSATTIKSGLIRRYVPVIGGNGDQGAQGLTIGNSTHLNVTDRIVVENSDFSGMGSGGSRVELFFEAGGTGVNQAKVYLRNPRLMAGYPSNLYDRDDALPAVFAPMTLFPVSMAGTAVTANRAYYARFAITRPMTIAKIAFVTTAASGSDDAVDVGIYDSGGTLLVSKGATTGVLNTTAGVQAITITSTVLPAGIYYAAVSTGTIGTTAASLLMLSTPGTSHGGDLVSTTVPSLLWGFQNTAHPLPSPSATIASGISGVPLIAVRES